ncbi:MAG TPA: patatin-like phospholipase family protein [Anaerolineae bacterium]
MSVAFVMSGAANFGSLQVGALQVLLERGIQPDMLIGTSAGAMNAAYVAMDPTREGLHQLAEHWRKAAHDMVSRRDVLLMVWRLITNRDGLVSNTALRRFVERTLPPGIARYSDLKLPAYAVAVRLDTGELRCFGDDPNDRLLDGLMASTAIPGFYPPWRVDGADYIDGGVVAYLPVQLAVERGATEVYALNVTTSEQRGVVRGTLAIAGRAIDLLIQRQGAREVEVHQYVPGVVVHNIALSLGREVAFWDFRHTDEMIARGREQTETYLKGQPESHSRWRRWRTSLFGWRRSPLPAARARART